MEVVIPACLPACLSGRQVGRFLEFVSCNLVIENMIIFLYGEDSFRSSQKLLEIKKRFLVSDKIGSGLAVFNWGEKGNKQKLLDVLSMPNLLAPKRLVIVRDMLKFGMDAEKDELIEYLKKKEKEVQADQDLVIIFWEDGQPKKNGKLYKILDKISKSQNFEKLTGLKLNQWIVQHIKDANPTGSIGKGALEKLILFVGSDTNSLDKEIQKLVDFTDGKIIQEDDVEILVKANVDVNIFNTIDAMANNNKKEALRLLQEHLSKGEVPFQIFAMFVYQFRNLLKVADLQEQYHNNDFVIAKAAGLHPFVVKKSLGQIRNFSLPRLKEIYQKLSELDTQLKTGQIEVKLALDKFIVEL
ncbi:MAG: DNA polymerase III subunit delta [Candidatus Moranbacteria bacterium CG23_combo_of_CG06-09_8_20_14_all_39_10]|nr:MAG: DNA polymerase III subunit delta [Candidatus Moranbacteria bacterium CG23_combo_of_CG06-09_8_20_14_all_39_10]